MAECADGAAALDWLRGHLAHVVLLDVDMPGVDGWHTLAELRRRGFTQPVLMVTHVDDPDSRIKGLDTGADDYIGKPCSVPELLARVRAVLRRAPPRPASALLRLGPNHIDLAAFRAERDGRPLRLSRTDYALLALLHAHAGRPVARELVLQRIWAGASGSSHALDTHVWRLRRKLADAADPPRWLRSVPGVGYSLHPEA